MPSLLARGNNRVEEIENKDRVLLSEVVGGMSSLLQPSPEGNEKASTDPWARRFKGVEGAVRERCVVDIIAGYGELAFNPEFSLEERKPWKEKFSLFLAG